MNITRDAYKPMLQWQPQHPIHGKVLEISSHAEYPSFKKPRICENFAPNHRVPWAMKEAASNSLKAKQCESQCRGFGDDDSKRLCRMFCNGRNCSYGDRCRFLHAIPGKIRDISMISAVPTAALINQNRGSGELDCKGPVGSLSAGGEGNFKPSLWKTKLCNNWKMTGSCPYGNACCFAHGQAELQMILGGCLASESWIVPTCSLKNNVCNDWNRGGTYFKQQLQETKGSLKRKQIVKLCDIYADWIEDVTILPSPSCKLTMEDYSPRDY